MMTRIVFARNWKDCAPRNDGHCRKSTAWSTCRRKTCRAVIFWISEAEEEGPPIIHRLKSEDILTFADESGFRKTSAIPLKHMVLIVLDV